MPRVLIPGVREALQRQRALRETAFFATTETVCGHELRLLTAADVVVYESARNAFFTGGEPGPGDVAHFLWWQSAANRNQHRPVGWLGWRRWVFACRIQLLPFARAVRAIQAHIDWQLIDTPGSGKDQRQSTAEDATCLLATAVDLLASEYHWSEEAILRLPLARVFQYVAQIQQRRDPSRPVFNPLADKVRGDWLRANAVSTLN